MQVQGVGITLNKNMVKSKILKIRDKTTTINNNNKSINKNVTYTVNQLFYIYLYKYIKGDIFVVDSTSKNVTSKQKLIVT